MEKWVRLILKDSHDHSQAAACLHHALLANARYKAILRAVDRTLGTHAGRGCYLCAAIQALDDLLMDLAYHVSFIAGHSLTHTGPDELPMAMDLLALSDVLRGVSPRGVVRLSEPDGEIRRATVRDALGQLMRGYEASLMEGKGHADLDQATDAYLASAGRYMQSARQGILAEQFDQDWRPVGPREITQLSEEHQRYNDWMAVRTCALALFGPRVYSVVVKVAMSGDGVFPFAEDLDGYDELGTPMPYDFALPLFHQPLGHWSRRAFLEEADEQVGDPKEYSATSQWEAARQQAAHSLLRDNQVYRSWGLPARLDASVYSMNMPPAISFPLVYAVPAPASPPSELPPQTPS